MKRKRALMLRIETVVPLATTIFDDDELSTEEIGESLMEEYGGPVALLVDTHDLEGFRSKVMLDGKCLYASTCSITEAQEKAMAEVDADWSLPSDTDVELWHGEHELCLWCGDPVPIPFPIPGDQPFCDEDCMTYFDREANQ